MCCIAFILQSKGIEQMNECSCLQSYTLLSTNTSWSWSLKSAVVHGRELKNSVKCAVRSGLTWKRVFQPQDRCFSATGTSHIKRLHKFMSRPSCHLHVNYDCMFNLCFAFKLNLIQPARQVLIHLFVFTRCKENHFHPQMILSPMI